MTVAALQRFLLMSSPHSIHSIRLSGPWEVEADSDLNFCQATYKPTQSSAQPEEFSNSQRIKFPISWREIFDQPAGKARFRRRFNSPTGLSGQRLWIRIDQPTGSSQVLLNSTPLGQLTPAQDLFRFEISQLIQPANILELLWEQTALEAETSSDILLWKNLCLEIEE